jgi:hypothetical protein
MNWLKLSDEQPAIGERVIINTGVIIIGAKLSVYLHEKDLYWLTDLNTTVASNDVLLWTYLNYDL